MKRFFVALVVLAVLFQINMSSSFAYTNPQIGKKVEGQVPLYLNATRFPVDAINVQGIVYLPVRSVSEILGLKVEWISENIYISGWPANKWLPTKGTYANPWMVDKVVAWGFPVFVNGKRIVHDAIVVEGVSYLPVGKLAEAFGMPISYQRGTIFIKNKWFNPPVISTRFGTQVSIKKAKCGDFANWAQAQHALFLGATQLDRDKDGVACETLK